MWRTHQRSGYATSPGVFADAYEFCKVVTHPLDFGESTVRAEGPLAVEWMQIAQPWIEPNRISDQA